LEQLSSVFDSQLIDDDVFSNILKVCARSLSSLFFNGFRAATERRFGFNARLFYYFFWQATWGTDLGSHAVASREEKRRAEYVLPFKDRVGQEASAKK
jgi:hypothetical protein